MVDYDYQVPLGEEISATKIKALFNGLDINAAVNEVKDRISELSGGSDKVVWIPEDFPDIILKLAEGTQIKKIPVAFTPIFQPFYEYVLPAPIEYRDIIYYRVQVQNRVILLDAAQEKDYYPNNKIKIYASHKGLNRSFLWALNDSYGEDFVIDFCKWNMETGVSDTNWGLSEDNKPKIFDYGSVQNEKWREIALIQHGFYYDDGLILTEIPE